MIKSRRQRRVTTMLIKSRVKAKRKITTLPNSKLARLESGLNRELKNIFYNIIDDVINKLKPFDTKEANIPINIDKLGEQYKTDIYASIMKYKRRALETAGVHMANQFKVPFDVRYFNDKLVPIITDRTFKIVTTKITPNISDTLKDVLTNGIEQGASIAQIMKHFDTLELNHRTIARTEINSAANDASFMLASKELNEMGLVGTAVKGWETAGDERVRDAHFQAGQDYGSGSEIPFSESFNVMGEPIMFPCDYSNGSAGNIINCRCRQYILPAGRAEN